MRKTYAYNGITLGILFGIAAWAATSNGAVGIAVAVAGNLLYSHQSYRECDL